jgi:hypothetical protein
MGKRKKLLNYCLICIIFIFLHLPIRLVKGKVECYKFPFHVDSNKIYYPDWHRKILFAHSKENCSIVQRISGIESFFRFLLGDENYFFNFPKEGYMEVIDKQKGEKIFSKKLTLPIYIFGRYYHISPENIWLTGEYLSGDFYQESLLRINRKNFKVDIFPICRDCAVRIVSEKPIYYPFEPIGGSNSKEMGKEFLLLLLVNELSWMKEKKGEPIRIQVFSVKDERDEEVSMEKRADFQVPSTLIPITLSEVWKDRVFIYSYNLTPPTLFIFSFDGNIVGSFEVKKKYFYFLYRVILFPEDEGIKILKPKENGEYELHFIRLEDERGKDVRLLGQDGNTVLLHFYNRGYEGNSYILDLESLELRRINLGISKFSFLSVAIEDDSIFILDVEGRIFRKVSVDGTILCEQKIEELRVCPDYCDFYFFCLPLCPIFSVLP